MTSSDHAVVSTSPPLTAQRRGLISESSTPLANPRPSRAHVPGMLLDDPLFVALSAALDDVLAPTVVGMDCIQHYVDPWLTPADFLPWLGSLVGADSRIPGEPRAEIAAAVPSYAHLGTAAGIRAAAARAADVDVDSVSVIEPGGVSWSTQLVAVPLPGAVASGTDTQASNEDLGPGRADELYATIRVTAGSHADIAALTSVVAAELDRVRPAHCALHVEVT